MNSTLDLSDITAGACGMTRPSIACTFRRAGRCGRFMNRLIGNSGLRIGSSGNRIA